MGVIPWGFESPLRHQVGRPGNGVRNYRTEDRDTNGDCGRTPFPGRSALRAENRNSLAREARCGELRFLVSFCERGASPPFTLSPRSRGQRTKGSLPLSLRARLRRSLSRRARKGTPTSGQLL